MSGEQGEEFKWLGKGVKKVVNEGNDNGSNQSLRVAVDL